MKKPIYALLLLSALLFVTCTHERSLPSGFDSLHRDSTGEIQVAYAPLIQMAQYRAPVSTGLASTLLLGQHNGVSSRIAIRFKTLTGIDTASVYSATLNFNQSAKWGIASEFSATVHRINTDWAEKSVTWDSLKNAYEPATAAAPFNVQPLDSTTLRLQVPAEWVNEWIEGGANYGILLDFAQASFMAQFISVDVTTSWPTLDLGFTTKSGVLDTVTIPPTQDVSLLSYENYNPEYTLEPVTGRAWIDNAAGYRTLLRFDFSAIPRHATIHQALFSLDSDQSSTFTSADGMEVNVHSIVSDSAWQNLKEMKLDDTYIRPTGTITQGAERMTISTTPQITYMTAAVQRITVGNAPDYGFVVQSTQYGRDMSTVSLYAEAQEGGKKPGLKIIYALPASPRF